MAANAKKTGLPGKNAPPSMDELQAWFGRAISRPLPLEYEINPLDVSAPELRGEGEALLHGRGGLSGFRRAGIYNQQYWFRLVGIMQSEYACALHVMGLKPYNAWAIRYLAAHPPSSPFLARLDEHWLAFLAAEYRGGDREEALQAAAFDRAFSKAFDAPEGTPLSQAPAAGTKAAEAAAAGAAPDLMSLRIRLAPHVTPLKLNWDFPAYRALCLGDESLEQRFELVPAESRLVIYRGKNLVLWQQPVSSAALKLLLEIGKGGTLPEAFNRLEGALDEAEQGELEANLMAWFRDWSASGWLCLADPG